LRSDGTIHVSGNNTVLTLLDDNLRDYVTAGGTIQVDAKGSGAGNAPELELNQTTIDGNSIATASFTIDGTLLADGGTQSTIENFDTGATFQSDGTFEVSGAATKLTLSADNLNDYVGTTGGTLRVDANAELDLTNTTTIDGNSLGTFTNAGTLLSLAGLNTIKNFASGNFSNTAGIEVKAGSGPGDTLTGDDNDSATNILALDHDTLTNSGTVTVDAGAAELELTNGTTISGGTLTVHGELESVTAHNTVTGLSSFSNDGRIEVLAGTLTLSSETLNDYFNATGGTILVTAGELELNQTIIDGNSIATASFTIDGTLLADGGTQSTIENFDTGATLRSDGTIHVTGNNTVLTLLDDNLKDYVTAGGTIQVDAKGSGAGNAPELELNQTTIDGNHLATASFTIDGTLLADGGTQSTIENFDTGATLRSDGTIHVTGNNTVLTLLDDNLKDYVTAGGTIQVDAKGSGAGNAPELELNQTTIDGNHLATASFTIDGTLLADGGTQSTIENFDTGATLRSDGTIHVTGNNTVLTLLDDNLRDYVTAGGTIQVDAKGSGAGNAPELELNQTTIDGNHLATASFTIDGTLLADGGRQSTIENFDTGATLRSDGTIHVSGNNTVLTLLDDNLRDYVTAGGDHPG